MILAGTSYEGQIMERSRAGFTLIELLVVLTIVALIASVSWAAYGMSVENARAAATRTTLVELQLAIDAKTSALANNNIRGLAQKFQASYAQGGNPSPNQTISESIAEIIVRKTLYKGAMPTRVEDMWGFDATPGTSDDSRLWGIWKRKYQGLTITDLAPRPIGYRIELENSELLYLFLTDGAGAGEARVNAERLPARHKMDQNSNGLPEFVDDWGSPIRFYGWTHRLTRPDGNGMPIDQSLFNKTAHLLSTAQTLPATPAPYPATIYNHAINQDPDDPTGALSDRMTATGLFTVPFDVDLDVVMDPMFVDIHTCPAFDEESYHALDTRGLSMVISAGPDRVLGLIEPTEQTNPDQRTAMPILTLIDALYDNVTTRH